EEECHPTVRGGRAGESVLGAEKTVALGTGLARERRLLITGEPPKQAEDRKKPNPSACTGLAEHLVPRRHELIQSFPRAGERRWRANPSARQGVDHRPGFDVPDQGKSGCRADNTYGNEEMLRWLDDRGITPYIRVKEGPNSPPDLYGIEKFTYVPEENCYLCPAGKPLNYVGINKRNRAHRYYSTVKRCRGCGQKPQCTRGKF